MVQVSNENELLAAIRAAEPSIQILSDLTISAPVPIRYEVTLESQSSEDIHSITKAASCSAYLFCVLEGGELHLRNIRINGGTIYNRGFFFTEGNSTIANGVYLDSRSNVVYLTGALDNGSFIQLDNSVYVSPNPQGTPIVVCEGTDSYPILAPADAARFQKPQAGFHGWKLRLSDDHTKVLLVPICYFIHYENLMGTQPNNPDFYTVNSPDIILNAPTAPSGYRFTGWFDTPKEKNQVKVILHGSKNYITLYAGWQELGTFTLSYYENTNCWPLACYIPSPLTVHEGDNAMLSFQTPVRKGYRFAGWNTDPEGKGKFYPPSATILHVKEDISLYAIWEK